MSFKRPTEASWDSDEDEELLSINTKFKGDDDEELDEDALLGSDEEFCQSSLQTVPQTSFSKSKFSVKTPTKGTESKSATSKAISTTATNRNGTPSSKLTVKKEESVKSTPKTTLGSKISTRTSKSAEKPKKTFTPIVFSEPEPVLLLDPEESYDFDESGINESIIDSSQSEGTEDDLFVKPQVVSNLVTVSRIEEEQMEDQSDVSTMEVSADRGQDSSEESDESDDEDGRRGRFKTERQGTVNLTSHKPVTNIPDTLEISKEQEEEIEQFFQHGQKKHHHRFSRGRGRGRFPNHPQRRDIGNRAPPMSSQGNAHNQFPPSFSHEAPPQRMPNQSPTKPQKIHINPHFRRGAVPRPQHGDGLMPTPTVPPQYRPPGPPPLTQLQHPAPIVHSAPQSGPWTSQANPQPMYTNSHHHPPPHHVQAPPVHHQYPGQQSPPRLSVPYPAYSRGPPPHAHPGPQPFMGPHHQAPRSAPAPFHGQQYPPHSQYHRPPQPQPLMTTSHRYPSAQPPPQPLIRAEPPPHHVRMAPSSQQGHGIPPPPRHHYIQQEYPQQRYPPQGPAPEPRLRHDFQPPPQAQQPPRFQQRAPGYQNQPRPQGFHPQGQRMPRNPNSHQNNGGPRQPLQKPKQNAVLLAHVKKLKDRAKKFGQTPPVGATKPLKRPSTEDTITEASPLKQSKVEIQLTPEDKELQEKLALQAHQRELIRKRKEANRQALAQKKREQLTQRLAEKGQTIEDIEQPEAASVKQIQTIQTGLAPKKVRQPIQPPQVVPHIKALHANQVRFPNAKNAQSVQTSAQKTIGNIRATQPFNKVATNQPPSSAKTAGSNKKLMKRIETVKKNAQGDIISREIKLVPIEDEAGASEEKSMLNHGKVQVIKKSAPVSPIGGQPMGNRTVVSGNSGNRSVISPGQSPKPGNRAVIRLNPAPGEEGGGDQRNVVSQQGINRRIVVASKPKTVVVKNLSVSTSDTVIKNLCSTVGPVESIERAEKDAKVTFIDGKHAALFAQKYNRTLLDLSTILVSLIRY